MNSRPDLTNKSCKCMNRLLVAGVGVLMLLCVTPGNSPAQTYRVIHNFSRIDGVNWMTALVSSGTTLYGAASTGGSSDYGTLFKINTDSSGFAVLRDFTNWSDGAYPRGSMAQADDTLYGATSGGGNGGINGGSGVLFRINTDGSGYTVLKRFDSVGGGPLGGVLLSGSALYGTTLGGGSSGWGTVFRINIDGSGFTYLKQWTSADGAYPFWPAGNLVSSDMTLYGTTSQGGSSDYGTVFKINTDGTHYGVLRSMCCDGPFGNLMLSGNSLYGTTGNMNGPGTVFRVNTDGSGYATLKQFNSYDGQGPLGGMVMSGTTLYGTTAGGGISNNGVIFKIDSTGSGYTVLKYFLGSDGSCPTTCLAMSGSTLYGITSSGGISNSGVLFALGYPPTIQAAPQTQTAEVGSAAALRVKAGGSSRLCSVWYLNDTNLLSCSTNCELALPSVRLSQSGAYTVVVSNVFGAVTSAPALLNVIAAVERRPVPGVKATSEPGSLLNVYYADSLSAPPNWTTLGAISLTNTSQYYFDLTVPLPPQRLYRAWQTGTPGVVPSLDLHLVPAITLTGIIGHSVRLDYINQYGPIDAWVTLDTVTLTNVSQLYFDVSALGQPQRLYRLVPLP
jgi:uncharacterized repeat protein (TIGR03803 family)